MIYFYDYTIYYRQNCIVPLIFSFFMGFALLRLLAYSVKHFKCFSVTECGKVVFGCCIVIPLLVINIVPLLRGGIFLLFEKETDKELIYGVVESITEIPYFLGAKYDAENANCPGESIVVNGNQYYLTYSFDLQPGDAVSLYVLPKSGFVLQMKILD